MRVPKDALPGAKLRLRGKGIPGAAAGVSPGDLYAVLVLALPAADTPAEQDAYRALAKAFNDFQPRRSSEGAGP